MFSAESPPYHPRCGTLKQVWKYLNHHRERPTSSVCWWSTGILQQDNQMIMEALGFIFIRWYWDKWNLNHQNNISPYRVRFARQSIRDVNSGIKRASSCLSILGLLSFVYWARQMTIFAKHWRDGAHCRGQTSKLSGLNGGQLTWMQHGANKSFGQWCNVLMKRQHLN